MSENLTLREKKRIESDERILQAAAKVFGSMGYSRATLTDIASEAGVSQGLVSQRFGSKEKLLCETFKQTQILYYFDEKNCHVPEVFFTMLDHLKQEVTEKPDWFRFLSMIHTGTDDIPESFADLLKEQFTATPLYSAILEAQEQEDLPEGDPWNLFRVFFRNATNLIGWHNEFGLPMPENETFLYAIQYSRRQKQVKAALKSQRREIQTLEADRSILHAAVSNIYPLIICSNLTKNTYSMLEHDRFTTTRAAASGEYDELIREGLASIPNPVHRSQFSRMFSRENVLRAYENGKKELCLRHLQTGDDGVVRWIETRLQFTGCQCGDCTAISLSRQVDDEMKRLQSYGKALQNAELAARTKSRFLTNLSHEIRTPMNIISGYTELITRHPDDPEKIRGYVEKMRSAEKDLMDLLSQALDAANMSLGNTVNEIRINIPECCGGVQNFAYELAAHKGVELSYEVGTLLDDYIYADEIRLQKFVMDLIVNAINESVTGGSVAVQLDQLADPAPDIVCLRLSVQRGNGTDDGSSADNSEEMGRNTYSTHEQSDADEMYPDDLKANIEQSKEAIAALNGTIEFREEGQGQTVVCVFCFKRAK